MTRRRHLAATAALLAAATAVPGVAPVALADVEPQRQLGSLTREIERLDAERRRLAERERGVLGRIETLGAEARLLDARLEKLRLEAARAEEALRELEQSLDESRASLAAHRAALGRTARVLHRLGPLGSARPLLGSESGERVASGLRLVSELSGRHKERVAAVREESARLRRLAGEREVAAEERERLLDEIVAERGRLESTLDRRRAALASLREQRTVRERALAELGRARDELREIVAGARDAGGWTAGLDVTAFRGLLPMPVSGRIVREFGVRRDPRLGTTIPHPGWDIEAEFGARVRVPFEGVVAWTGWLRGYGLVVVVDHGAGIHSVYAHLSVVLVEKGQPVAKHDVVARVGDTGSLRGPYLYFELREGGKAVDPDDWIDRDVSP